MLLLEIFTGRRPADNMFNDGLTLHRFAKMNLPEKLTEIVDPSLLLEPMVSNTRSHETERARIKECLVAVVRVGVICLMESPSERIQTIDVKAKLRAVREIFISSSRV